MQLTLHPAATAQRPAVAAFLAGAAPLAWLRELGTWPLAPAALAGLACYVVPESVQSVRAAGLLVLLPAGSLPPPGLREPLGVVAGRLYLPTHAALRPAAPEAELRGLLHYPVLLYHPASGLVGFEASDCLALADLLAPPPLRPADWTRAQPGAPAPPPLRSIRVQAPTVAEVLADGQADVGTAPLTELPNQPAPPSPLQQTLDALARGALRTGLAASQGLLAGLGVLGSLGAGRPAAAGSSWYGGSGASGKAGNNSSGSGDSGPGPLERLRNYLAGSLDDLERKRNNEVERLLALFGQDMEAALRFAIPLGGPYQHRGTAAPGSHLGPRATEFNLGGLGGGQRVDGWDLGAYQDQLRASYLRAAAQETAAGRFKKAAYIHAHLLGDFRAAAQALVQGGYFREAAALYRDHLHDLAWAADTLEKGNLLPEAIDIYRSLNEFEKVGQLYDVLGQPAPARASYEQAEAQARTAGDTLRAARLLAGPLGQPAQAEALLLAGWAGSRKPEAHLKQYLLLLGATRPAALPGAVRALHQQHTLPDRQVQLLQTLLAALPTRLTDPALQAEVLTTGLDIIGQAAAAGQFLPLSILKKLLPHDPLLPGDTSRYLARQKPKRR